MPTVDQVRVLQAMGTPDGAWRIEVVQRGAHIRYELRHDGTVVPGVAAIGPIEWYLREQGVDMADLVELPAGPAA